MVAQNANHLEVELEWFRQLLTARMQRHLGQDASHVLDMAPPALDAGESSYARMVAHYQWGLAERAALMLSLAPHLRPQLLDVFYNPNPELRQDHSEFGGLRLSHHKGFMPTAETLYFLLADRDLENRFLLQQMLGPDHAFAQHHLLWIDPPPQGNPLSSGALTVSDELLDLVTLGEERRPNFSTQFPAQHITTQLTWENLVLPQTTLREVDELKTWMELGHTLLEDWGLGRTLRPGYRCLYYGPPGTGKTMTACLLGQATGYDVYRVDLSMVISKYIGETEKNLSKVFEKAEHRRWILFFDEADALFGQRTRVENAHDRYANQEVSYLLQRIEQYAGVVILATNHRHHLDAAFTRRFESVIHFPMPSPEQRIRIWQQGFSPATRLGGEVNLNELAKRHELTGGSIMNVIRYSSLQALQKQTQEIALTDLEEGIRREFLKEGKTRAV
ncbi:MAG TPA: AAA family ATPase [Cytophagales bacterium]|nr:AAA family ATPase [Cytophagales bacterium]